MIFSDNNSLNQYRLEINRNSTVKNKNKTSVDLYGVYKDLTSSVITFTKISKRYLYDRDEKKYEYPNYGFNNDNDLIVFTSANEAWHFFSRLLDDREKRFKILLKSETKTIKEAHECINRCIIESPEHFI